MNEGSRKYRAGRRLRRLQRGGTHGFDTHTAAAEFSEGESRVKSGYNGVYRKRADMRSRAVCLLDSDMVIG